MDNDVLGLLRAIDAKLDGLAKDIAEIRALQATRAKSRTKKAKPPPATPEEIASFRSRFQNLYTKWLSGSEIEVHDELDKLELEDLRRFSDANNLNVTSKMSKQRMLELVAARFREKRQLHKQPAGRSEEQKD